MTCSPDIMLLKVSFSLHLIQQESQTKYLPLFLPYEVDAQLLVNKSVKEFLKLHFPDLLALNKVDLADAVHNLGALQTEFKHLPMVSVSAMCECISQKKCKEGEISYQSGASFFGFNDQNLDISSNKLKVINEQVFQVFGNTGVLKQVAYLLGFH